MPLLMPMDLFAAAAGPPFTGLLDQTGLGSAAAAYSVARKLRSAYAGAAIRVQRSSDSTQQDIGFASNALDTAALASFVGSGSGDIVKLYDQSGNALDATPGAAGRLRVVASGTLVALNGKPAAHPTDSASVYSAALASTFSGAAVSAMWVGQVAKTTGGERMLSLVASGGFDNQSGSAALPYYNGSDAFYLMNGGANVTLATSPSGAYQDAYFSRLNASTAELTLKGATGSNAWTASFGFLTIVLGGFSATGGQTDTATFFQEAVLWLADVGATARDLARSSTATALGIP